MTTESGGGGEDVRSLWVPVDLRSDSSDQPAEYVYLLPSEVECERVMFKAADEDDPGGYVIPVRELQRNPHKWAQQLSMKKTREGFRPSVELLAEALEQRLGDEPKRGNPG